MVSKVKYVTEIGYFGRSQNVREVRAAPSLASMITSIASLPSRADRDPAASPTAQVHQLYERLPGERGT